MSLPEWLINVVQLKGISKFNVPGNTLVFSVYPQSLCLGAVDNTFVSGYSFT